MIKRLIKNFIKEESYDMEGKFYAIGNKSMYIVTINKTRSTCYTNKDTRGRKRVIKRYYYASNNVLVKVNNVLEVAGKLVNASWDTINYVGKSFFMTEQNLSKAVAKDKKISNIFNDDVMKKVFDHRVLVEGVNEESKLEIFSTFTSKPKHDINLKLSEEEIEIMKKGMELKIPALKVAENNGIKVMENFIIKHISIEKKMPLAIEIRQKDIIEMPKGLGQTIREKKERMMEKLGWKDYEFFQNNKGQLFGVHKEDIEKIGNIIVHVKFEKARPVTLGDYAKMSKEIANNQALNEYMGIDMKTKEMYENNYKIWSELKKD